MVVVFAGAVLESVTFPVSLSIVAVGLAGGMDLLTGTEGSLFADVTIFTFFGISTIS
jgi:hypothetical protein